MLDQPSNLPLDGVRTAEDILAALVAFDTTSCNSNLALIGWVEAFLARHGIAAERVFDATGEKANLWATIGPADAAGVILSGHTDTVPVDGQDWTNDPFQLTERDGKLYGRGTTDMKGFIACVLAKVPEMVAAPLKRPIHIALSYDEEIGCVGVQTLIAELAGRHERFAACLVGEPTAMQVVTAHKSKRAFAAHVTGLTCHSALAPHGVNALYYAARIVAFLEAAAERLAAGAQDPLYDVAHATAHVGIVSGGTAVNIVPDTAQVVFELRLLPDQDLKAEAGAIAGFVGDLDAEMRARDPRCGVRLEVLSSIPGLETPADADVVGLAKRLAGRNDHAKVAFGTEGGRFSDDLGVPTVVVGPGSIDQAHKADEFIAVAELRRCEAMLDALIDHCRMEG